MEEPPYHVRFDLVVVLGAPRREAKARVNLVVHQRHPARFASGGQLHQPLLVGVFLRAGGPGVGQEHQVRGRRLVGVERLQRVDHYAGQLA